jgi:ABC-type multidrug transport system fused ATPase/permease subunit
LVLDKGRLIDSGTHEALSERCEVYRAFLYTEMKRIQLETQPAATRK